MEFRQLKYDAKTEIQSFFNKASIPICDYSFSTIFTWRKKFKPEYCISNDFLIIRYFSKHHFEYLFPIGKGNLKECIKEIIAYAEQQNETVIFGAVTSSMYDSQLEFVDDNFLFVPNRDNWEYVYETQKLVELKGKSFQPKRNFINRFKNNHPNYIAKKLDQSDFANCIELTKKWFAEHRNMVDNQDLDDERVFINEVFSSYYQLNFDGVGLYVENELVAFAVGSQNSPDVFIEHIEKANSAYVGAYPMINHLFAQMVIRDYGCGYINREEDMGLPTLRKAKLQYNPSFFLEKGGLVQKEHLFIDIASKDDIPEIMSLWKHVFGDEKKFLDLYFNIVFPESISLIIRQKTSVIASLQLIPYHYVCEGKYYSAYYIYAVMTDPKYRNQGYMTMLIHLAKQIAEMNGKDFLCLVPDDSEELRAFYRKFGFFDAIKISTNDDFFECYDLNLSVEENYQLYLKKLSGNSIMMPFSQFNMEVANYTECLHKEFSFKRNDDSEMVYSDVRLNTEKKHSKDKSAMVFLLNENLPVEKIKGANGGLLMVD